MGRQSPMSSRVSLNWTRRFAPPSRTAFKRGLVTWLGLTTISLVALVKRTDGLLKALLGGPALLCASVLVYGTYRKERGQLPFSEDEQRASAERLGGFGRHVTTKDGRVGHCRGSDALVHDNMWRPNALNLFTGGRVPCVRQQ